MATATAPAPTRRRAQRDGPDQPRTPELSVEAQAFIRHVERTRGRQDAEVVALCDALKAQQQEPTVTPDPEEEGPGVGSGGGKDPVPPPPPPPPPGG